MLLPKKIKKLNLDMRAIAITGTNNISSELAKRGQKARVTYTIKQNIISFIIEPYIESVEDIPEIEKRQIVKDLGDDIPLELLNQEMAFENFSVDGIDKAMERTQEQVGKKIQDDIGKLM